MDVVAERNLRNIAAIERDLGPISLLINNAGAFAAIDDTRPTVIFAYTVKGYGLAIEGHPQNHSALRTEAQLGELAARLRAAGTTFAIEPYVRFEGEVGEQWTMFCYDPAGNAVEFKAFADESQLFAT